jgi:hypothetical protein
MRSFSIPVTFFMNTILVLHEIRVKRGGFRSGGLTSFASQV